MGFMKTMLVSDFKAKCIAVLKEVDAGLNSHGLIKVRVFGDDREARIEGQSYQSF